ERRIKKFANKRVIGNLIRAGAFDFDEPNRAELLYQLDLSERTKTQIKNNVDIPKLEYDDAVKAQWEMDVLGLYLSVHPMERYGFEPLTSFGDGAQCLQGGEIYDTRIFKDKNNNEMAFIFIDTLFGNVKLLIFSR